MDWKKEGGRFAKFLVVGTLGAVVDFGTFNLLTIFLHLYPNIAQAISFTAAVINNFIWNRFWTYPDSRSKPLGRQLIQFGLINLIGLIIRTPVFIGLTPIWKNLLLSLPFALPFSIDQLSGNLALGCAVFIVLIWNFAINRLWTYNDIS